MKLQKTYKITSILTYVLPLLALLLYFYVSSNDNIKFIIEAPRFQFVGIDKEYDFVLDEFGIITIEIEEKEKNMVLNYNHIIYNDIIIENGTLTVPLENEFVLNGIYHKYDFEKNEIKKIVFSEELKEAFFVNKLLIGLSIMIIGAGIAVSVLMIIKKMDVLKAHRRLSLSLSFIMLALIFLILSVITEYLFLVFIVFAIITTAHYIEWLVYRKANGLPLFEEIKQKVVISNE